MSKVNEYGKRKKILFIKKFLYVGLKSKVLLRNDNKQQIQEKPGTERK